ncbi:hypothetical protein [Yinghuangia soli]|uniref:Uncharacterized protein n=1 Tax=Yinghuangia soli TaxID=2908204 RepID=A0AA41Q0M4_9ACTN|nr:hypothetical protein [Yinghuangia soli]MCF2529375.1 hypothetical protein [Yinghuangia soli]
MAAKTAKKRTTAPRPAKVQTREKPVYVADFGDLTGPETDRVFALVGIKADQMGENFMSVMAATAVVIEQRKRPALPDSTWKTLKMRDIEVRDVPDLDNDADPTSEPSESG